MIKFGFKRLVEEKDKPLFTFPYLVVGVAPIELKKRTEFKLVNAREELKFDIKDNKLSWLYDQTTDKTFYLININGIEAEPSIKVNLDLSFSDAKLYTRMYNALGLDGTKEHYFELVKVADIEGLPAVKLAEIPMDILFADSNLEDSNASPELENAVDAMEGIEDDRNEQITLI
jgi:hypothetical protein